jgi:superfamily I DNA/RNA helicase
MVRLLNVGSIPSDMATGSPEEIEEERRLLYVAMTRAKDELDLIVPHRFYTPNSLSCSSNNKSNPKKTKRNRKTDFSGSRGSDRTDISLPCANIALCGSV